MVASKRTVMTQRHIEHRGHRVDMISAVKTDADRFAGRLKAGKGCIDIEFNGVFISRAQQAAHRNGYGVIGRQCASGDKGLTKWTRDNPSLIIKHFNRRATCADMHPTATYIKAVFLFVTRQGNR